MSIQADAGERSDALMEWGCKHSEQIAQLLLLAAAIEGFGVVLAFTFSDGQAVSLLGIIGRLLAVAGFVRRDSC